MDVPDERGAEARTRIYDAGGGRRRVHKRCSNEERVHQLAWFRGSGAASPTGLCDADGGYAYDFVDGQNPVSPHCVPAIVDACQAELWSGPPTALDPAAYWFYVGQVSARVVPLSLAVQLAFLFRTDLQYTAVRCVHGDLTLENLVWGNGVFTFLDPGFPRGLPCRELDETKLMQSLEESDEDPKSEELIGDETMDWYMERIELPTYRALLGSHYVRLLGHRDKHPEWRNAHALRRLEELCG